MYRAMSGRPCAFRVASSPRWPGSSPRLSCISIAVTARYTISLPGTRFRWTWSMSANGSVFRMNCGASPFQVRATWPVPPPSPFSRFAGFCAACAARVIIAMSSIAAVSFSRSGSISFHRAIRVSRRFPSLSSVVSGFWFISSSFAAMRTCSSVSSFRVAMSSPSDDPGLACHVLVMDLPEPVCVGPGRDHLFGGDTGELPIRAGELVLIAGELALIAADDGHPNSQELRAWVRLIKRRAVVEQAERHPGHALPGAAASAVAVAGAAQRRVRLQVRALERLAGQPPGLDVIEHLFGERRLLVLAAGEQPPAVGDDLQRGRQRTLVLRRLRTVERLPVVVKHLHPVEPTRRLTEVVEDAVERARVDDLLVVALPVADPDRLAEHRRIRLHDAAGAVAVGP